MDLVAVEESRLVELLMASRPQAQLHVPTAIAKIQEKYNFPSAPETLADTQEGMRFFHGSFMDGAIGELSIYSDGVVLVSKSPTSFLIEVLEHLKSWAKEEFNLRFTKTNEIDRLYQSHITVRSKRNLMSIFGALDEARNVLESELMKNSRYKANFVASGFNFAVDPQKSVIKPSPFKVERRSGVDFDYGLYDSVAPLTTDSHLKLLEKLEKLC